MDKWTNTDIRFRMGPLTELQLAKLDRLVERMISVNGYLLCAG
jgi:hypothetical protein